MVEIARGPEKIIVGAGIYTDVVSIVAPSQAMPGNTVNIIITIKNLYSSTIGIMVGGALEYGVIPWPTITFPTYQANVPAGQSYSFSGSFQMPNKDVKVHAYSYYYATDGLWYFDDEEIKSIKAVGYPAADIKDLEVVITAIEYPAADIKDLEVVITAIEYPAADIKDLEVVITAIEYPAADIKDLEVVIGGGLPPEAELFRNLVVTYKKV